ncbi:tetratricopeptide repeat protein [Polyangium fumosum]|nr:tetratricopeptide repeat protein [Polyangium fumosum]
MNEFRRMIGASAVVVRCAADLDHQAEGLLDAVDSYHRGGVALCDRVVVEFAGIPFTMRQMRGELVLHGLEFANKGAPDTAAGAEQSLRIVYDQEAVARRAGAEPAYPRYDASLKLDRSSLKVPRSRLQRMAPSEPRDSGWSIGGTTDKAAESAEFITTVAEIYRVCPWFSKMLALPPGYSAVVGPHNIESIESESGEHVWILDPLTLARFGRSALERSSIAVLERAANALLESITNEGERIRPVRRLARRRAGSVWVTYANALTVQARFKQEGDRNAELDALVDELRHALSPGGKFAGEAAPYAIIDTVVTLYRLYWRDEAAEVLDGLVAPGSSEQAALLFLRAAFAIDSNNYAGAVEALQRSVVIEPNSATTWYHLGAVRLAEVRLEETPPLRSRFDKVIEAFERALALLDIRGTLPIERCIRDLNHSSLRADWELADLLRERTVALREAGRLDEALASAERLVNTYPDQSLSWEMLGTVLTALYRYEDALKVYDRAIQQSKGVPPDEPILARGFASPWYNRAALLALLGHRDEAVADLRYALNLSPDWYSAVFLDERFQELCTDQELQRLVDQARLQVQAQRQ